VEIRAAATRDIDAVTRCITLAFATDPVWEPALRGLAGQTDHHESYWRLFVESSIDQGGAFMTDGGEAVSIWIPPGGQELSGDRLTAFDALIERALEPGQLAALRALFDRFEASRAPLGPHYYLSLLATHPDHRGRGIGQALLADDLARWDVAGAPSYLESTNPANDHRYARAGFRPIGGFEAVLDGHWVTAMWRDIGGGQS
jgi:GNAT superfamily N-acetyltransferase